MNLPLHALLHVLHVLLQCKLPIVPYDTYMFRFHPFHDNYLSNNKHCMRYQRLTDRLRGAKGVPRKGV